MTSATLKAKDRPLFSEPTDYEDDVSAWCFEQAELLRQRRFGEVDLSNLIEEIESLGNEQIHAVELQLSRLMLHLLKWSAQPERRGTSWSTSIRDARYNIDRRLARSPSLKSDLPEALQREYHRARRLAADETGLPLETFPAECPFTLEQLRNEDWLPA